MADTSFDFHAYARRTGFDGDGRPTLATLAHLVACHARSIPFENVDAIARRVPALDLDSLQRKLVATRRGGYCFEQNNLLLACLAELGFAVRRLEARVRARIPEDVVTGRTHMALCVTIDGTDYLADVGFGGFAPTAPLRLSDRGEQPTPLGAYRFVEGGGDLLLQARTHEGWNDCYRIGPDRPHPIDEEIGNWFVATHPKSMLRQNLLVARSTPRGRLTLFNRELSLRAGDADEPVRRTLATRAEIADALADEFGLQLDAADFDAVMATLEAQAAA
jgi:N-hydroxyarylamine O-acetyltransferase